MILTCHNLSLCDLAVVNFARRLQVGMGLEDDFVRTDSPSSSFSGHFRSTLTIFQHGDKQGHMPMELMWKVLAYNEQWPAHVSTRRAKYENCQMYVAYMHLLGDEC